MGKDCCWCCNRLAYHLGAYLHKNFKLPGTHGIVYGWKPPRVGIPLSVLKSLEDDLWVELVEALGDPPRPRGFRQNSGWSVSSRSENVSGALRANHGESVRDKNS